MGGTLPKVEKRLLMKKIPMILALACMASLTACQEESSSTRVESATEVTSSVGDSVLNSSDSLTDLQVTEEDDTNAVDLETSTEDDDISEVETEESTDVSEQSDLEGSVEDSEGEVVDEEHKELLLYINDVDVILDSFEESLNVVTNTAIEYLLNPENTALLETYCQNMVDVGATLSEIGTLIPPIDYQKLHNDFAENCETLADSYYQMVDFLTTGTETSVESKQLEIDMVQIFTNMQDSLFTLCEEVMNELNG